MPGRKPPEAFENFIKPIKRALACVARAQITTSPGGRSAPETAHQWQINGGAGVPLERGLSLHAEMVYEITDTGSGGDRRWKVTTRQYMYALHHGDAELIAWHWHPWRAEACQWPHLHIGPVALKRDVPLDPKHHVATDRVAFEHVVLTAIEMGVQPIAGDWKQRLNKSLADFQIYRSWPALGTSPLTVGALPIQQQDEQ